ncbi:LysR family transcriptional regulator [Paucibacter soli]|uniref:LysR family transcriptional regulator n=1 Tax=Paucibacter soli TaxID=3133433 RepID=UPI0030A84A29
MNRPFEGMLLSGIELFCLVAQHQGFTAAARASGLTTAGVSRSVNRLEARLGVRLLTRTTRTVRLTPEGERYYEQCREALRQLVEAEREVTGQQLRPSGLVRISLPTSYGHFRVLPLLDEFMRRYPEVALEVQMSNRNVNFAEEGFDLAIRGREPPDSGLVARKLEDAALLVAAAPSYLRAHGTPQRLEELDGHECIQFLLPRTGAAVPWLFKRGSALLERPTTGRLRCAEDILAPITLARAGAGLVQTYRFLVADLLRDGSLQEVLGDWAGASRPFSLLYPGKRHLPLRVRVLIDFLLERLGRG